MILPRIGSTPGGASLEVRLQPRSSRKGVGAVREGALELKVGAPPVEGRANEEARRLIAELLGISRSKVTLMNGARSRRKVYEITGLEPDAVRERVADLLKSP
jgi:hypothetical protein